MLRMPRAVLPFCVGCVLVVVCGLIGGCSDETPPKNKSSVTGKTPVVRPEDLHNRNAKGATLAPDYRHDLASKLDAAAAEGPAKAAAVATASADARPAGSTRPTAIAKASPKVRPDGEEDRSAATASAFPAGACGQLLVVVASTMRANTGVLRRFVRKGGDRPWEASGPGVACKLGRNGLAVGRGLTIPLRGPAKHEGDGRTPAGLFPLPEVVGYATAAAARAKGVRLPYLSVTDRSVCVTDPASPLFGRIVGPDQRAGARIARYDRMVRCDEANRWGVVIAHNRNKPDPEAGSCLFLNVRPAGGPPTGGSIGLPEEDMAALAAWLDPAARPLLLVVPESAYRALQKSWKLPAEGK